MDSFEVFKMIFYALDNQYDNNPSEELGNLLSSMNPFLFKGRGSAISDIFTKFEEMFNNKYKGRCTVEEGYQFAKDYLKTIKNKSAEEAFQNVSLEDWKKAVNS